MRRLNEFIKWFLYITPGITFVCAVNVKISGDNMIPAASLWQILISGFLTAAVTVFLVPREGKNKPAALAGGLLHYTVLSVVMVGCGCWFGWMEFDMAGMKMMLISVAVVYWLAFSVYYLIDVYQAGVINRKLKEKYSDKE